MASKDLIDAIENYDSVIGGGVINNQIIDAYTKACSVAFYTEQDISYGLEIAEKCKRNILTYIKQETNGTFKMLEGYQQENKKDYDILRWYYSVLLMEAPYLLDSFMLYMEKNRPRRERFYEPRRMTLHKIVNGLQRLENDELDELFIHEPARTGKLIADDTPVFTSDGWKTHGDLKVGDMVVGSSGKFIKVLNVMPKFHTTHTVTLKDGTKIDCHENHEWTVYDKRKQSYRTLETKDMIGNLMSKDRNRRGELVDRCAYYLPPRPTVDGIKREFKLHPYVLGAWLGDGTNRKPWITDPKSDEDIIKKIESVGYPVEKFYIHKTTGVYSYSFGRKLVDDLREYGMCYYDRDCEKHIPVEYLTASKEQRLELLAGLLDTDGSLTRKEKRYHFSTVSTRLKDDVAALVRTFGWRVCVTKYAPHTSSFGIAGKKDYWVIAFNPDEYIPCALERKQLYEFTEKKKIGIASIVASEHKSGNCITVDSEDGLYAVGENMHLTHNSQTITFATLWHCARHTESSNLYVTYKEGLGGAFLDGFQELMTDPTYCFADVFPKVKIVDTDAKNNKIDLATDGRRRKKYKSISGKGLESGLNGEYDAYGWLVLDDLYEGIQDVLSADIRRRKQLIFDNNVMTRAKEQCKKVWNGTIWSLHDIFMNRQEFLAENPDAQKIRYEIIKIPALDPETDESNFDYDYGVGFSTDYYRMLRSKFEENDDLAGWFAQCQQEPIERNGAIFDPNHLKYYNGILPDEEPLKVVGYVDVATGGGDYVSFPIAYVYADGRAYIHDVVFDNSEKHITEPQVASKIKRHDVRNVRFEANQGGVGYKEDVERILKGDSEIQFARFKLTTAWAKNMRGRTGYHKEQRIWDNAESIRQFYFRDASCRDAQYRKFMQNLLSFSMNMKKREHDDAADSLSGLVDFLSHGSGVRTARVISSPI